jgi:hypothetical protein
MKTKLHPRIKDAERLNGGVIITFDDGKCAVYSATLLRTIFPQADEVMEDSDEL